MRHASFEQFEGAALPEVELDDRFMVFLDRTGDTAVTWDQADDLKVLTFVQKKIAEGYIFFIYDNKFAKLLKRKKALKSVNEIGSERVIYYDDPQLDELISTGTVNLVKLEKVSKAHEPTKDRPARTKDPREIVKSRTFAVRPLQGG